MRPVREMMRRLVLVGIVAVACAGCNSSDHGDVATAEKGAARAPKSVAQLPSTMPPDARASAAAAIGQAKAAEQMNGDQARIHALEMMRQQKHR